MKTFKAGILINIFIVSTICFAEAIKYSGTINSKYPIEMIIEIDGNVIEGYYCYNKIGEPIKIEGSLNNNHIKLAEKSTDKTTGYFDGSIENNNIIGTWSSPDKSKSFPFELVKKNTLENLDAMIFTKLYPHDYDVHYFPIICLPNNKKCEDKTNNLLEPANLLGYSLGNVESAYYEVNLLKGSLLSLEINYGYEGANYIDLTVKVNIDISTGEKLSGDDLFKLEHKNDLLNKINRQTEKEISIEREGVYDEDLELFDSIISQKNYVLKNLDDCFFTDSGVVFEIYYGFSRFNYDIKPNTKIKFTYHELKKYFANKYVFLAL